MAIQRVKGQEVQLILTRGGVVENTLVFIEDATIEVEMEIIKKKYLGKKTDTHDDIMNGVKGDFTLHIATQDYFRWLQGIKARQQRSTPDVVFNLSMVLAMPGGDTPSIIVPDIFFEGTPIKVGNRGEYVQIKHGWAADDFDVQFS